ncbi:MAG: AAA family ATPase [Bacteroidales bacterium]|nr:AAA family ATPase [Bacteroidales bacterium]
MNTFDEKKMISDIFMLDEENMVTSFGITVMWDNSYDFREVAARLFVCHRIVPEKVKNIVDMLVDGKMSISKFLKVTDAQVADAVWREENSIDFSEIMATRKHVWSKFFGSPSDDDYYFLEEKYGISMECLFDDGVCTKFDSAKDLSSRVKEYVKGQDDVIDQLAVPFFQHLESKRTGSTMRIKCPTVLMGATGSGKSEIIRRFAELCDCPVVRINTIDVVPNGWRGNHICDIFGHYLDDRYKLEDLEYAIVVFHEFDKIAHYQRPKSGNDDMDGDYMREIMRMFESDYSLMIEKGGGDVMSLPKKFDLPTQNFLVIFDGAFVKMEEIVKKRLNIASSIGFNSKPVEDSHSNFLKYVNEEDLITWGFMPELVGRIGQVLALEPLSSDVIYQIMTTAKDSILLEHIDYCHNYNLNVKFEESALRYISDIAYNSGMGFRNVKTILSKCMNSIYYEYCSVSNSLEDSDPKSISIDKDYVARQLKDFCR